MNFFTPVVVAGILSGMASSLKIDWDAFKNFKSFQEAAAYNWKLAAWRAVQGALIGLAGASGVDVMFG